MVFMLRSDLYLENLSGGDIFSIRLGNSRMTFVTGLMSNRLLGRGVGCFGMEIHLY